MPIRSHMHVVFMICAMWAASVVPFEHAAADTCAVVQGVNPVLKPSLTATTECANPPCAPNACAYRINITANGQHNREYYGNPEAIRITGKQQVCGPITKCRLEGDDPPISHPNWDEPSKGYEEEGNSMLVGKCSPYGFNNNVAIPGVAAVFNPPIGDKFPPTQPAVPPMLNCPNSNGVNSLPNFTLR